VVKNKGHLLPIQSNLQIFLSRRVILRVTICNFLLKTLRRQCILIKKEPNFEGYPFSFYKQFNWEQNWGLHLCEGYTTLSTLRSQYEGYTQARRKIPMVNESKKMEFWLGSIFWGLHMKHEHILRVTFSLCIRKAYDVSDFRFQMHSFDFHEPYALNITHLVKHWVDFEGYICH